MDSVNNTVNATKILDAPKVSYLSLSNNQQDEIIAEKNSLKLDDTMSELLLNFKHSNYESDRSVDLIEINNSTTYEGNSLNFTNDVSNINNSNYMSNNSLVNNNNNNNNNTDNNKSGFITSISTNNINNNMNNNNYNYSLFYNISSNNTNSNPNNNIYNNYNITTDQSIASKKPAQVTKNMKWVSFIESNQLLILKQSLNIMNNLNYNNGNSNLNNNLTFNINYNMFNTSILFELMTGDDKNINNCKNYSR